MFIAYLKPSRQLLEFYRKKFAEQECDHGALIDQLQNYKTVIDKQVSEGFASLTSQPIKRRSLRVRLSSLSCKHVVIAVVL